MKLNYTLLTFLLIFCVGTLSAQDRHFTLYNMTPLALNPALTGAYEGSIRIGGLFRDQNFAFNPMLPSDRASDENIYVSSAFFADAPILTVRKRDWISAGISFYDDTAGSIGLGTNFMQICGAYHLSMNKKGTSVFTLGLKGGTTVRGFQPDQVIVNNQLDEITTLAPDPQQGQGFFARLFGSPAEATRNYFDLGAGIMLRSQLNKTTKLEIGLALDHINSPGRRRRNLGGTGSAPSMNDPNYLSQSRNFPINMLFTGHGRFDMLLSDQLFMTPSFLIQATKGTPMETVIQVPVGFIFNEENNQRVSFGLGYRIGDAVEFLLGYDHKDLRVAASFDLTTNSTQTLGNNGAGAFEVAAYYIIKIYKEPKIDPVIICPRF